MVAGKTTIPPLGWRLLRFDTLDSTNRRALDFESDQPLHGSVFLATHQSAGRGRQGRQWYSPKKLGLYASVILREGLQGQPAHLFSMMTALAIYDVLAGALTETDHSIDIKWPNDIVVNGKKICGILGEMRSGQEESQRVVIGFSINIYHTIDDFPDQLRDSATSLHMLGISTNESTRDELLHAILEAMNAAFQDLLQRGSQPLIQRLTRHCSIASGKRLTVRIDSGDIVHGTSCGLNDDGSLQIRLDSGLEIPLYAGEVHLLPNH